LVEVFSLGWGWLFLAMVFDLCISAVAITLTLEWVGHTEKEAMMNVPYSTLGEVLGQASQDGMRRNMRIGKQL
jgi:hypothetical protein